MKLLLTRTLLLAAAGSLAHAHFVFVVPEAGSTKAKVIISEDLKPAGEVGIEIIAGAKLQMRGGDGRESAMTMEKASDSYVVTLPGEGTRVVHGFVDMGYSRRGTGKPHLLLYYPKTILGDAFDGKTVVGGKTPVEIIPAGKAGALRLLLLAKGKPAANAEITVILPDGTQKKAKTDAEGLTEVLPRTGRYGAWARYWEPGAGERDGKKYEELRHYAMLVFDTPAAGVSASRFATMPEAASSFGSVVSDGYLYVYGGHISPTHNYSREAVSGKFHRLALGGASSWQTLPGGPGLQGMNLAAHGGKIYRIGGMAPRNYPGEPADNHSVADCARFDPATKKWTALPPLPEARSSHDVVAIGDRLYVAGGWALQGKGQSWFDTMAVLDLAASPLAWKTMAQPFRRRALMAAAHGGKLHVIGGFNDKGQIVREMSIFDPATEAWSEGPKLPAGPGLSFAPAAGEHAGALYVSVSDGTLLRLKPSGREWERVGKSTARLAHRIASNGGTVLVIGGADKGKNSDLVEAVTVEDGK